MPACLLLAAGCARVPRPSAMPYPSQVSSRGFYHTVEHGQTFYKVAKLYRVDAHELMRLNGVRDPRQLAVGQRLFVPRPIAVERVPDAGLEEARRVVGEKRPFSSWRTITLHHSGTLQGDATHFDRDHRRRHMGGLFYHFVIGNGSYASHVGQIETGWRWKKQVKANRPYDIQICVVGDFSRQQMSEPQFRSLVNLIKILREQYGISIGNIRRHQDIKGKNTECPGKYFPFHRLLSVLANRVTHES